MGNKKLPSSYFKTETSYGLLEGDSDAISDEEGEDFGADAGLE